MTSYTCPGCGQLFKLAKRSDLQAIALHAKTCEANLREKVVDLPPL